MKIVVAIHDRPVWAIPDRHVQRIVEARPDDLVVHVRGQEERLEKIPAADVLFAYRIGRAEFAAASHLKWVHSPAVGVGSLLVPDLVASEVVVTNSRGLHSETIAEHALALVLALRRGLHVSFRRQAAREWAQGEIAAICGAPLSETRMLVVGLGTIGTRVAQFAAALGIRVDGVRRRSDRPKPDCVDRVFAPSDIREALPDADAIVVAVPGTAATRGLIGRDELAVVKKSAVLVNVARGDVVDEAALAQALSAGTLAGAGLDVFAREPLEPASQAWDWPNVIITPHVAPFSGDYWPAAVDLFLENLGRFKRGEPLLNLVDKSAGY